MKFVASNLTVCARWFVVRAWALFFLISLTLSFSAATFAQDPQKPAKDKGVILKVPEGFMPVPLPKELKGMMMLQQKKPAGMFIFYPAADQTLADLSKTVRTIFAPMFIHHAKDAKEEEFTWTETALPGHENALDETGLLSSTADKEKEVQVATYLRTVRGHKIAYGYFGMRHKKATSDDAPFLDDKGQGVKEFDKFWATFK